MEEYFNKSWIKEKNKYVAIAYNKTRIEQYRCIMHNLKINGCALCGYNKCDRSLHFHHTNPEDKKFNLMQNSLRRSNDAIADELNKCILLCANCHMEVEEDMCNYSS